MIIPKKPTISYSILEAIYKNGPMTYLDCIDQLANMNVSTGKMKEQLSKLLRHDNLELIGGLYALTRPMEKYLADIDGVGTVRGLEIVKPRTPPVFRPIQSKYLPSLEPRRPDTELRTEHAIYCSGTSPEPFRGVEKG